MFLFFILLKETVPFGEQVLIFFFKVTIFTLLPTSTQWVFNFNEREETTFFSLQLLSKSHIIFSRKKDKDIP
jgi:hypothetical protein